jgi:ADP-ribose pyrophosphatase YjhB (NUDIX family)
VADIPCIGAVVFDDAGRLLLVKRANPPAQGLWSLPGGRQEPGESAGEGVVREVREETGLVVKVDREVGTVIRQAPSGDDYVIRDFVCVINGDSPLQAADDAADAAFFTMAELAELPTSEGLVEALTGWGLIDVGRPT